MHFHEALNAKIEDFEHERKQLEHLFFDEKMAEDIGFSRMGWLPATPLAVNIAPVFRKSRLRGTAANLKEFFSAHSSHWAKPSLSGLLYYCEILLNILHEFKNRLEGISQSKTISDELRQNIDIILEKTNHTIHWREDNYIEILQKDALASTVVEDLTDAEAARAVLEYTHYGLQGNLGKKRELLRKIGHYVEPILQDEEMKASYGWLTKDLGCCLNNLHIRHNNKSGDKANAVVQAMSDAELEACYDGTYRELLLLIELQKNLPFHRKVEELRGQLGGKKDGEKG